MPNSQSFCFRRTSLLNPYPKFRPRKSVLLALKNRKNQFLNRLCEDSLRVAAPSPRQRKNGERELPLSVFPLSGGGRVRLHVFPLSRGGCGYVGYAKMDKQLYG